MVASHFLKTRISPETKRRVQEAARQQLLTESIWLRRVVDAALRATPSMSSEAPVLPEPTILGARLSVRLCQDDRLLLSARAAARGMKSATYVSVLTRSHLRRLTPLPADELLALKRSVAELGAIGRNLNQNARAANLGDRLATPGRDDLVNMLKVGSALRDHVKALIKANLVSWEAGNSEADG